MRRRAATPLLLLALAGLGGCGGEDADPVITSAEAICTTAEQAAAKVPAPASFEVPAAAATYFRAMVPITARENAGLVALAPDAAGREGWDAFLASQTAVHAQVRAIGAKADAGADPRAELERLTPLGRKFAAAASAFGAEGCAS